MITRLQEATKPTAIMLEVIESSDSSSLPTHHSSSSSKPSHLSVPENHECSKPRKTRKSWGQVLPEPKTSLLPHKRAKTEDEKEQRRIERVKRNRLAAHNSRERKRKNHEALRAKIDQLNASMQAYKEKMVQTGRELNFYRSKYHSEVSQPVLHFTSSTVETSDTIFPALVSESFSSTGSLNSMDSPHDPFCQLGMLCSGFESTAELDLTQYSAAVLCDLQCRSILGTLLLATLAYLLSLNLVIQSMRSPS